MGFAKLKLLNNPSVRWVPRLCRTAAGLDARESQIDTDVPRKTNFLFFFRMKIFQKNPEPSYDPLKNGVIGRYGVFEKP